MKALLIAEEEQTINALTPVIKGAGAEIIVYRWLLKALDNVEEIAPEVEQENGVINSFTFAQSITDTGVGSENFLSFGFIVFAYSALFFFLASLILKSFSSRSRNIPF